MLIPGNLRSGQVDAIIIVIIMLYNILKLDFSCCWSNAKPEPRVRLVADWPELWRNASVPNYGDNKFIRRATTW